MPATLTPPLSRRSLGAGLYLNTCLFLTFANMSEMSPTFALKRIAHRQARGGERKGGHIYEFDRLPARICTLAGRQRELPRLGVRPLALPDARKRWL